MNTDHILVPFGQHNTDLKALYYAFALAQRMQAKVFVLLVKGKNLESGRKTSGEAACMEMIRSACEEGRQVSFHIAEDWFENEIAEIIQREHIDLIVIGSKDAKIETALKNIRSTLPVRMIQVKEKDMINPLEKR